MDNEEFLRKQDEFIEATQKDNEEHKQNILDWLDTLVFTSNHAQSDELNSISDSALIIISEVTQIRANAEKIAYAGDYVEDEEEEDSE